jgi:cyanophycin synthetase
MVKEARWNRADAWSETPSSRPNSKLEAAIVRSGLACTVASGGRRTPLSECDLLGSSIHSPTESIQMTTTLAAPPSEDVKAQDLRVTRVRPLRGPNYWRLAPVIACDVRLGSLELRSTAELPGFTDRLLEALPTLHEHPCSRGATGGFVERLKEGTRLPHVLEHVSLELQTLAGCDVSFGRVVASGDEGVWWVIVEYEE